MDSLSESSPPDHAFTRQIATVARPSTLAHRMADVIRDLANDVIRDMTKDGDAGADRVSTAMTDMAAALWTRFLKFDAADSRWPDRDRFILSAGHAAPVLYALIHLTGHDGLSIGEVHPNSAASSPDYGSHPAIETMTGPPGQGFATAVGMALAERNMAARFGKSLVDHRTWVLACHADMMQGVTHEAAAMAGCLGLAKLAVMYDQSHFGAGEDQALPHSEDVLRRFSAYGWATKRIDGHDPAQIAAALSFAVRSKKPTLLACRPVFQAPPVAPATVPLAKPTPRFVIPDDLRDRWHGVGSRGAASRRSWLKRLARHNQRGEFERVMAGRLPDNWHEALIELKQQIADDRPRLASQTMSRSCLQALLPITPELICGSAELGGRDQAVTEGLPTVSAGSYGGRHIRYGANQHGMAAAGNGMALHGGIIPCIGTAFAFSDYLRPALRLAAIMRQRVIYILTDDPCGPDEGGQPLRPVEQLASLRATPNLHVFRPCDAMETAECWELAMRRTDAPSLLVLSCQALPSWRTDSSENRCARGGYVLAEADGARQATLIATGSEVPIAMAAREILAGDNIAAAVVSLPSWDLFAQQDEAYRAQVLGGAWRVGIEAAGGFGWEQWIGPAGTFIGMTGFGESARHGDLYRQFAITPEAVVAAVIRGLG